MLVLVLVLVLLLVLLLLVLLLVLLLQLRLLLGGEKLKVELRAQGMGAIGVDLFVVFCSPFCLMDCWALGWIGALLCMGSWPLQANTNES